MKKFLIVALLAGLGYVAWKKLTQDDAERDLWSSVTDDV